MSLPTFTDLTGSVALVTGAASGIGAATAALLAEEGARVVLADIQAEAGQAVAEQVGGRFVSLDVRDAAAWTAVVEDVVATEGRLDIAHLNAGLMTGSGDICTVSDDQIDLVLDVNVRGVIYGARAAARAMAHTGGGGIVATASVAGLIGWAVDPIYTTSKHAVVGLVRSLDPQLGAIGISINAVCPGIVDTNITTDEVKDMIRAAGVDIMPPRQVAEGVLAALRSGRTGTCFECLPGRLAEPFEFGQLSVPLTPLTLR